ncbi:MAG: polysaccharide deacetylase family protein [Defluviitaleaceae bacterium]|nr:polysaccharide deacetylase family protein [Defluviitaleaceae bacterium]
MRSKGFWLAVLAMVILITVISCHSPRGDRNAGADIMVPIVPLYVMQEYTATQDTHEHDDEEPEIIEAPPEPGELDLNTETILVAGRYAGFMTWGFFRHSATPYDIAVAESLVKDTHTGAVLEIADIIDMTKIDKVLSLLAGALLAHAPESAPYLDMIDDSWLTHVIMEHEGLGVLLTPEISPWGLDFVYILLPYEDLDEAFLLGVELGIVEPPHRPMVALTFDDGPSTYTLKILDILEQYGARATFCVLGYRINRHPELLIRAVAMGSEVIGHSWDHRNFTQINAAAIATQITRTSEEIEAVIGQTPPPIMRAPFGQHNNNAINAVRDMGYSLLHWSVDPQDWYNRDADVVYTNIMRRVTEGSIILLHDIHPTTVEAMRMVIPRLIADGFQLVTASELIAYHYGEMQPGEIYVGFRNINW